MLSVIVAVLVSIVPGAILALAVPTGAYRWAAWAATPALTLGLTAVAVAWLPAVGLPHGATAVLVAELLLAGLAVLASRLGPQLWARIRRQNVTDPGLEEQPRPDVVRRADLIGVTVAAVVAAGVGWVLLGRLAMPPGWDAMNHGFLTRRILEAGSVAIPSVCTTGSTDPVAACSFYPLAANVNWAQAVQLSGGHVSTVMAFWAIVIGPLAMVAGIFACVRALGGSPVVATCAATAPAFLGPMWTPMLIGRVTQQTAPCLAAGIALLVALALRGRHPFRLGALAGVACAGLVLTHTYDALFVAVLALALAAVLRGRWRAVSGLAGAGTVAVVAVVAMLPLLGALAGADGERVQNPAAMPGHYVGAFRYWVASPQRYVLFGFPRAGAALAAPGVRTAVVLTIACMAATPLCFVFRELRWARPWFVTAAVFCAVGAWTSASNSGPARALSGLWYGTAERLRDMFFPVYGVLAVAGAVAVALAARWLLARIRRAPAAATPPGGAPTAVAATAEARDADPAAPATPGRWRPAVPAVAAVTVLAGLAALAAVPSSWRPLRGTLSDRAPVGRSYDAAFAWLARHTPPGKVIAYDRNIEFMPWAYADYGVPTLFGIPPLVTDGSHKSNFNRRWQAFAWLVDNPGAVPAGCAARDLGVEYVVVGARRVPGPWLYHYNRARLDQSPRVTLVHQVGDIKIYRVTGTGTACSG